MNNYLKFELQVLYMNYEEALHKLFATELIINFSDPKLPIDLIKFTKLIKLYCPSNYILEWVNENEKLYLFDIIDIELIKQTFKTSEEMVEWSLING